MLRAGLEPATCRLGVDNRNRSGPQQKVRRGREVRSGRGVEPQRRTSVQPLSPDNRAASARDDLLQQARQVSNPDRRGWSSPCFRLHHGPKSGRPGSNGWRSGALPSELRPRRSLRQESNPHLGHTKGVCLPLTLRRLEWDGSNNSLGFQKGCRIGSNAKTEPAGISVTRR